MNKDYKRLTIRNDDGTWGVNYLELANEVAKWQEQHATQYLSTDLTNILGEKLAELEDKIENGTLKFMPCKVGDTVYMPWEYDGVDGVATLTVEAIGITENSCVYTNLKSDDLGFLEKYYGGVFCFEEVGKIIFLTKAEAEAKLAELKGERKCR